MERCLKLGQATTTYDTVLTWCSCIYVSAPAAACLRESVESADCLEIGIMGTAISSFYELVFGKEKIRLVMGFLAHFGNFGEIKLTFALGL